MLGLGLGLGLVLGLDYGLGFSSDIRLRHDPQLRVSHLATAHQVLLIDKVLRLLLEQQ